jgi:hypothetical protein
VARPKDLGFAYFNVSLAASSPRVHPGRLGQAASLRVWVIMAPVEAERIVA